MLKLFHIVPVNELNAGHLTIRLLSVQLINASI